MVVSPKKIFKRQMTKFKLIYFNITRFYGNIQVIGQDKTYI